MTDRSPLPQEDESPEQTNTRRLLADVQALSSRIAAVQEIATAINKSLELDEILNIVGRQAKWLLDFHSCSVCLVDNELREPAILTLFGTSVTKNTFIWPKQDPIAEAIETNQSQLIQETTKSATYQSFIILPLGVEDIVLGTINFAAKTPNAYGMEDLRIAYLLALQLASAIHNARQFKRIHSLYQELEGAYKNLRSLEEMRDQLINMIAHDLRSPISVMINTLDLISYTQERGNHEPERQAALIDRAVASGLRSINMIDDMLTVSKIEAGRFTPTLAPVSIINMMNELAPIYQIQAQREENTFHQYIPDGLPNALADFSLIARVIDNLVTNAIKYSDKDGKIIAEAEQKGEFIEIRIRDQGQGINTAHQKEIFDKYSQVVDEKGAPLRQGVGLGLTFCRLAVEAHNGRIWVKSTPKKGSTFHFTLPLAP